MVLMEVVAHMRAMEAETSVSNNRKRLHSGLLQSSLAPTADCLLNPCPSISTSDDHQDLHQIPPISLCIRNHSMKNSSTSLDLKAAGEISLSNSGSFSYEKTEEEMEASKTKRKKMNLPVSSIVAAEIEEFFSVAEKQEQKRFAEKYNYDIVKDVPLEGRYHWVCLKP